MKNWHDLDAVIRCQEGESLIRVAVVDARLNGDDGFLKECTATVHLVRLHVEVNDPETRLFGIALVADSVNELVVEDVKAVEFHHIEHLDIFVLEAEPIGVLCVEKEEAVVDLGREGGVDPTDLLRELARNEFLHRKRLER